MLSDWVSFLAYPNLFGIKGFVVVVVVVVRGTKSSPLPAIEHLYHGHHYHSNLYYNLQSE
jgi:hypothetical protein